MPINRCPLTTTSGLAKPSYHVGPRELYGATASCVIVWLPRASTDPTLIADGALPGDVIPQNPICPVAGFNPKFPAETITAIPACTARSTACTSGSVTAGS